MSQGISGFTRKAFPAALAGALVLALAACGREEGASASAEMVKTATAADESDTAARPPVDDKTLATRVRAALMASPALNAVTIDVAAARGVVTLLGTTNTPTKRDLAGYIALRVEGVNTVRNRIVVISSS
ncbi:MAG: BON domain-containing protein [Burkholderiales bacterium]